MTKKYTIAEIKEAFWKNFHKAGDVWFDYLGSEGACEESTESEWREFIGELK